MEVTYNFNDTSHRIKIVDVVKKMNNFSRNMWSFLKAEAWGFHGVVRDYSSVFSMGSDYMVIHHFNNETPVEALMGYHTELHWEDLLSNHPAASYFRYMEQAGFVCIIPYQSYLETMTNVWSAASGLTELNYHLMSPKHKLQLWLSNGTHYYNVEFFFNYAILPYGVRDLLEWPDLTEHGEYAGDMFLMFGMEVDPIKESLPVPSVTAGEEFELAEQVDPIKLDETLAVVEHAMNTFKLVIITYSGGKDSSTTLQLFLNYKIQNPNCKANLTVVSADTLIENPLLIEHVYKVKERVESLNLGIDFHIVTPDLDDTFFVCVFGKSYQLPSVLNRWCVSRLKTNAADLFLKNLEMFPTNQSTLLVLGTRSSESTNRAKSVAKHFGNEFYGDHPMEHITTCSPIKHWTAKDVITYLVRVEPPWKDYGNFNLINLYGSAMSGQSYSECPIGAAMVDVNEGISACTSGGGTARMGCAFCSVIKHDTSLINMSRDYEELVPYVAMRKVFKASQDIRYGSLTGYKRVKHLKHDEDYAFSGTLESGLGDLTIDIRILLLEEMKRLELSISEKEVFRIYEEVRKREMVEGISLSPRFVELLFSFLSVHPGYCDTMYSPIFDPYGCGVDKFTEEDVKAIERVKARQFLNSNEIGDQMELIL